MNKDQEFRLLLEMQKDVFLEQDNLLSNALNTSDNICKKVNSLLFHEEYDKFKNMDIILANIEAYIIALSPFIQINSVYTDSTVIKRLKELHVRSSTLKWFTDQKEIVDEIEKLRSKNIVPMTYNIFMLVKNHLITKATNDFKIEAGFIRVNQTGAEKSPVEIDFYNYLRNRRKVKEPRKRSSKMFEETLFKQNIEYLNQVTKNQKESERILLKVLAADTKFILSPISILFLKDYISKRAFYIALFPLLKLICKDKELLSQDEFEILKDGQYSSNYDTYRFKCVKSILE